MRLRAALAVVPLLLFPVACGDDTAGSADTDKDTATPSAGTDTGSLPGVTVTGAFGALPTVEVKDLKAPDEPKSVVLSEGDGPKVVEGKDWLVHLTLVSGKDGKKLISTLDSNQPISGAQNPIPGLGEALVGVPRGSRLAMETDAGSALSEQGLTQLNMTAEDAVVFVADLISVQVADPLDGPEGDEVSPPAGTPGVVADGDKVTGFDWDGVGDKPKELKVITLVEGEGPAIEKGRLVTFNYFGEVFKGTKPFDESFSKEPTTFTVGAGSLIPAWDEGLIGVKEGSRIMIISPPEQAYGAAGSPPDIPANATLVFVIDVLGVG